LQNNTNNIKQTISLTKITNSYFDIKIKLRNEQVEEKKKKKRTSGKIIKRKYLEIQRENFYI
jgi:hypothetical protein